MENKILPCSLCGGMPELDPNYNTTLHCKCGLELTAFSNPEVIDKWNRRTLPSKDETPFQVGDSVFHPSLGFGIIKNEYKKYKGKYKEGIALFANFDEIDELVTSEARYLFHASDPCLQIFGVTPEGKE